MNVRRSPVGQNVQPAIQDIEYNQYTAELMLWRQRHDHNCGAACGSGDVK